VRLEASAARLGVENVPRLTNGKLLAELFEFTAESRLLDPTFVTDFPADISPLAKRKSDDPTLTERFELYLGGMELANAFSELNDPDEQRARFEAQRRFADEGHEEAMPFDEAYLQALEQGLPPTGGIGIGIDRLVMLLTGKRTIREVVLFPAMRD
jgi:lysyl-tRNA synthetase class 2